MAIKGFLLAGYVPHHSLRAVDRLKRAVLGARDRLGTPSKQTQAANDLGVGNCGTSIFPVVVTLGLERGSRGSFPQHSLWGRETCLALSLTVSPGAATAAPRTAPSILA